MESNWQPRILYAAKLLFMKEGKVNFQTKIKWAPHLQLLTERSKQDVFQTEEKWTKREGAGSKKQRWTRIIVIHILLKITNEKKNLIFLYVLKKVQLKF